MNESTRPCRIAAAREADLDDLARLIHGLAAYERLLDQVIVTEHDLNEALFGARPSCEAALAFVGERAVGFACWFRNFSTFLGRAGIYLEDLFVEPEFRSRGIGQALLHHVASEVVGHGGTRLDWAVLDWNTPAKQFYESIGACPNEPWQLYRLSGEALERFARDKG
jgi:GNAT superfamily N-acetyltransferase